MLRKSKVSEQLKRICETITLTAIENGYEGVSAIKLANLLGMDRANVSKELNQLHLEKKVIKINGRPVYYFDRLVMESLCHYSVDVFEVDTLQEYIKQDDENKKDAFEKIIGNDGSLKNVIQKAKAAMIYPPFGLHTLLIGPTGVGKTMFAEIMYSYAKERGVLNENAEFVVFNCAEYADNPQLLLAQLFGYVKGAYTGAVNDSEGLVARANQGILFLDEIHRLPPEGQEMLFMLIDRGEYRRLGDNQKTSKAEVLILAATTENVDSSLLHTFLRRIPMSIALPSLHERSVKERFDLIEKFFAQEYNQVKIEIHVKEKIMKALLAYDCPGNIGQLKADIRLLCARGFLDYITLGKQEIRISSSTLPDQIYNGLFKADKRIEILQLIDRHQGEEYVFNKETLMEHFDFQDYEDIYDIINCQYTHYQEEGYPIEQISSNIKNEIEEYIAHLLSKLVNGETPENEELYKIVPPRIYKAVEVSLQLAEHKLSRTLPKKVYIAMSLHITAIVENERIQRSDTKQNLSDIGMEHPNEYQVAKSVKKLLENELEIELQAEETLFLTMFLCMQEEEQRNQNIALLVLAHGNGVARNMADVANTLMRCEHAHALDMPLKQSVEDFLEIVIAKVKEINEGRGVLILVDMGSLISFGELIQEKTGIPIQTIDMVTTPFVLEALRKTMLLEYRLEDVSNELRSYLPFGTRTNSMSKKHKINHQLVIICTCLTGEGAAVKLGNLLSSALPAIQNEHIEIIACNRESFKEKNLEGKKILAVVGAVDLKIENTIYLSSDRMIIGDGIQEINRMIMSITGSNSMNPIVPNFVVSRILSESLVFLDPIKANEVMNKSFKIIHKLIPIKDYNRTLIGFILHCGCMIERCIQGNPINYESIEERISSNRKLHHVIQAGMNIIEDEFMLKIPNTEMGYLMDLFDTD